MRWLFFLTYIVTTGSLFAQEKNYTFTNYTTAQGLPDNYIQSMVQDSRGFLWIGTSEGLSRFDGKNFKNFYSSKNDTIVRSNSFSQIYEYKNGHLVLNNYGRILCFNTFTEKFYLPDIKDPGYTFLTKLRGNNKYYMSGMNKGYILNNALHIIDSIVNPPVKYNAGLLNIFPLHDTLLLIQQQSNFYFYYTQTKKYENVPVAFNFSDKNSIAHYLYYDTEKKDLYFCEYLLGLYRYSLLTKKTEHLTTAANGMAYTKSFIYQIAPIKKNELWFLTQTGISILNTETNTISVLNTSATSSNSLINNTTYTSYNDKDNNVWIGTIKGLSKLNANAFNIKSWTDDFSTNPEAGLMSVIKGADENIYASVYLNKAYEINSVTNKVTVLNHPHNIGNWNLFARGNEIIRTGKGNTLLSYDTKTKQYKILNFLKPYFPNVELIVLGLIHSNGDEWYSANRGGGFVRKIAGSNIYKTYKKDDGIHKFSNPYYTCYTEDKNGELWFGVNKTHLLLHWNQLTDKFDEIDFFKTKGAENIIHAGINALTHDIDNIWIAFNGSGLIKYNPLKKEAIHYSMADGLPSNFIMGMVFDSKNRLWLSTLKGLSCFVIQENKFINLKVEDGLPDDNFTDYCTYFDSKKNELWLGSNTTLMEFNPDSLLALHKEKFSVYVDEIIINGKNYKEDLQNNLALQPEENNLLFHFTGVDLSKGKDIEYNYKLEPADKEWILNGSNQTASYAHLKPGTYLFKVRAKHKGDNQWNEIKAPLKFSIDTPWNKTWWFILLVIAGVSSLIWYFIKNYYTRKLEKQRAELEKQNAIEQERTRMARELHDGLGSMLSGIKHSFSAMSKQMLLNESQQLTFHTNINKLNESIKELRNISHSMASEGLLKDGLENSLRDYCNSILQPEVLDISFSAIDLTNINLTEEQAFHTFRIVQELLHNITKHANATQAIVQLSHNAKHLYINVEDNGKGFALEQAIKNKGMGLKNIESRVKILKGKMDYQTEPLHGTSVMIEIPCKEIKES